MISRRSFSIFSRILFNQNKPTSGSGSEKAPLKSDNSTQKKAPTSAASAKTSESSSASSKQKPIASKSANPKSVNAKSADSKPADSKPQEITYEPQRNDQYSAQEYYGHNKFTFGDWIVEMADYRLPQKSNKVKS